MREHAQGLAGRLAGSRNLRTNLGIGLVVVLLVGLSAFQLLRPVPDVGATILQPASSPVGPAAPALPMPRTGSLAVAVDGLGTIVTFGPQVAVPLASTAKIMAGFLILEKHPLRPTEQGPMVPVTVADVANYQAEKAQGQSVFPVAAGEQLSEFQALQALLVPSGNNIAELLATWDSGSVPAFVDKMNARAVELRLSHTHYADASGVSADTVGSPGELITLTEVAMRDPVFAAIVAQPEATLPIAGRVFNVDAAVGQDGIIGVKTGFSGSAGACFVFAADVTADQQPARIIGAVMGVPTLEDAFTTARDLIHGISPALHYRSILSTLQVIGEYKAPWGDTATVFADQDVNWVVYDGMPLQLRADLRRVKAPLPSGANVGSVTLQVGERMTRLPLKTTQPIFEPDLFWRLTRLRLF
jgi:serine-type D-Ala-D-Ala carboxypeptidase (penicillin-binding protein 5/6)